MNRWIAGKEKVVQARPRDAMGVAHAAGEETTEEPASRLASLAKAFSEHLGAYAVVILADFDAAASRAIRRAWAVLAVAIGATYMLAIGSAWLIAATWNTPARTPVMLGLLLAGGLAAMGGGIALSGLRHTGEPLLSLTRAEWEKDRDTIADLVASGRQVGP